jgi:polyisoprenoid-binding protein YceI
MTTAIVTKWYHHRGGSKVQGLKTRQFGVFHVVPYRFRRRSGVARRISIMATHRRWPIAAFALATALGLGRPGPAQSAEEYYQIDQTYGDIAFTVQHLGLFSSTGNFKTFAGHLVIDEQQPRHTQVNVTIDTASIAMAWPEAIAMLRSPNFFDCAHYPTARFASLSIVPQGADEYDVTGLLTIRGISRPVTLHAELVGRQRAPDGRSTAEFVVNGSLHRSDFGMVTDRAFISDRVTLQIRARVLLERAAVGSAG